VRRSDARPSWVTIFATLIVALVLAVVPLPDLVDPMRPDFLLLTIIYWSLRAPRSVGLAFATFAGLALDIVKGTVLGQHALGFLLAGFLTHRLQLRMRVFPIWQQAFTVMMMLALYQFLVFWIDGITGNAAIVWQRWLPIVTGTLIWPVIVAILDSLSRVRR
jgi:rod shape-determining protein MreD